MSGGHFDYIQYRLNYDVIEKIEQLIKNNKKEKPQNLRWHEDDIHYHSYSDKTINEFKKGLDIIRKATIYIQRIDWLVSGDDGEESFINRLKKDLDTIKT